MGWVGWGGGCIRGGGGGEMGFVSGCTHSCGSFTATRACSPTHFCNRPRCCRSHATRVRRVRPALPASSASCSPSRRRIPKCSCPAAPLSSRRSATKLPSLGGSTASAASGAEWSRSRCTTGCDGELRRSTSASSVAVGGLAPSGLRSKMEEEIQRSSLSSAPMSGTAATRAAE